jgi:hypothetical protein
MVTVYTLTYNEELLIEFFIKHYRKNFPDCKIVIYDNESTDNTIKIASKFNCEVITYNTNNQLSDLEYLKIKNNCWKTSDTDWNIICDCDELIEINQTELKEEESFGTNCVKFQGYNMVNTEEQINLQKIKLGFKENSFNKFYLFNKKEILEINYSPGCHNANPILVNNKQLRLSKNIYNALHYKYLHPKYTIERNKLFAERMSDENKKNKWGVQYFFDENWVNSIYNGKKNELIKLID